VWNTVVGTNRRPARVITVAATFFELVVLVRENIFVTF
jgi:hypothetical protein